ncbi:MAG: hypothetical protein ACHQ4G_10590 [Opitutales bacterium]
MNPQTINRITFWLLLLGLGAALVLYLAAPPPRDPYGSLLGDPLANKKYLRELQVMGGKANVLAAQFQEWWADQWHGQNLARAVAVLTLGTTLAFRFVARHPDFGRPDSGDRKTPPAGLA